MILESTMASESFGAKGSRSDDPSPACASPLQQPGTAISRHQIVSLTRQGHSEQKCIVWVAQLNALRQIWQMFKHDRTLHVVDHRTDAVRRENCPELGVATHAQQLVAKLVELRC